MSSSNSYQLLPLSSLPSLPRFGRNKRHHWSFPRIPTVLLILVPISAAILILHKLAILSNAFRTYEADAPTFSEPFRGTGEEVEGRADEFPSWVTTDKDSVEVTVWNVREELRQRLHNMGLPVSPRSRRRQAGMIHEGRSSPSLLLSLSRFLQESTVSCPAFISGQRNLPTFLESRYAHLLPLDEGDEPSPYIREPQGFYFALNLFNSKEVIPHLFQTLLTVAALLGPSNIHISIFENGSWDETTAAMAHFARALTALGFSPSPLSLASPR